MTLKEYLESYDEPLNEMIWKNEYEEKASNWWYDEMGESLKKGRKYLDDIYKKYKGKILEIPPEEAYKIQRVLLELYGDPGYNHPGYFENRIRFNDLFNNSEYRKKYNL